MTVKELQTALKRLPKDSEVLVCLKDGGGAKIAAVSLEVSASPQVVLLREQK